ncbi:MAG TPA: PAS domain-containing protein [Azospirillaceae bacterium]|nr:PAS domain-containing protein [Azospirillaceae bacterium]
MPDPTPPDFAALFQHVPTPCLVLSTDLVIVEVNAAYLSAVGRQRAELLGRHVFDAFPENPDDPGSDGPTALRASLDRVLATGRTDAMPDQRYDIPRSPEAGGGFEERWWRPVNVPVPGAGGVAWILHRVKDVTDEIHAARARRSAERQLAATEAGRRAILDSVGEGFIVLDREFRVLEMNRRALEIDGRPASDLLGRSHWELWPEAAGTEVERHYRTAMAERRPVAFEHHYVGGGHDVWLDLRAYPTEEGLAVLYRDISARKRAETLLAETDRRLRATWDNAGVGICEVDREGRYLAVNGTFTRMTGYRVEDFAGRSFLDMIDDEEDRRRSRAAFEAIIRGELGHGRAERYYTAKDGRRWWAEIRTTAVRDEAGRFVYAVRVVQDITERRRIQERQTLLMREVDHRAKNALAVVQTVVRLTRAEGQREFLEAVEGRIAALARAHGLLATGGWSGAGLRTLVEEELSPYVGDGHGGAEVSGPEVTLAPDSVQPAAMILHELATNAAKYGALSHPGGRVRLSWTPAPDGGLVLDWREEGGPPLAGAPARRGFGSEMVTAAATQLGGRAESVWHPAGLRFRLTIAADCLAPPAAPGRETGQGAA